jgi:lipid-binding SYLF domain-containing protein
MTAKVYRSLSLCFAALVPIAAATVSEKKETPTEHRLRAAGAVFDEILSSGDRGVPPDVLERARCVVIVPGVRNDLVKVGAETGKGFLTCRAADHEWSAPAAVQLDYAGSESDLIVFAMTAQSAPALMRPQWTFDGVVAGPLGRSSDVQADLFAYVRNRGTLTGIALNGVMMRQDAAGNRELYGRTQESQDIVRNQASPPRGSLRLFNALNKFAPENNRQTLDKH